MTTQTRKPRQKGRRDEILATFTDLVAEQGYDMTSVAAIAEELQLSKGTIMYHFGSKDQMLKQLSVGYMNRRIAELETILASPSTSVDQVRALVTSLIMAHRDDRAASVAFAREFMRFAGEPVMEEVRTLRRRYLELVADMLERGMTSGELIRSDSRIVALQLIGMCNWTWTWLRVHGQLSLDEISAIFSDTVTVGLAASPP
jgi:TetR/AcrR family transcriptional regulator, cholesterol catabolism regulator